MPPPAHQSLCKAPYAVLYMCLLCEIISCLARLNAVPLRIMKCHSCHAENRANARFCRSCGIEFDFADFFAPPAAAVVAAAPQLVSSFRQCRQCQHKYRVTDWFCGICGIQLPTPKAQPARTCSCCRAPMNAKHNFCTACGTKDAQRDSGAA